MGYDYNFTVTNHSSHSNYFMIYQNDPGSFDPNAMSLAWISKYSNPGDNVTVKFTWTIDWGFSWAETGELAAGVKYEAAQTVEAGSDSNQITLDYNGAFMFSNQTAGSDPAYFYIAESSNIPVDSQGSVGMTMSNKTVYATQARPNNNLTFSPHPQYYVAYGNYEEGEVIDVSTVNNPLNLNYETGVYSLSATLNKDDSWTTPMTLSARNTMLLKGRKKNPKLTLRDVA